MSKKDCQLGIAPTGALSLEPKQTRPVMAKYCLEKNEDYELAMMSVRPMIDAMGGHRLIKKMTRRKDESERWGLRIVNTDRNNEL